MALSTVVVMRHGESTWTDASVNRFAGWVDVPLTERGRAQAAHAGALLKSAGLRPDVCFTSLLRRSIVSAQIALDAVDRLWVPTERTWRLNERHYGAFQGQTRPAMRERYGEKLFSAYRWQARVEPLVAAGRTVLIVTHGSVVRAIKKELEGLSANEISQVNIPTGVPLTYEFECSGRQGERPRVIGAGSYLDPDAARAGIDAVNRLGSAQ